MRLAVQDLGGGLLPGQNRRIDDRLEEILLHVGEEANVDKRADEFGETLVTKSATDDRVSLRDRVAGLVVGRVSVGIGNECVTRVDEVGLRSTHELRSSDLDNLAVLVVLGGVAESEKHTTAAPGELVAQWVVTGLWRRKTTAVAEEARDFAASLVDLINRLDSPQVVDTWVQTDLVHDCDTGVLGGLVQLHHGWGDIGCGYDVLLLCNRGFDDCGVVGVWDEGDDEVILADLLLKGVAV